MSSTAFVNGSTLTDAGWFNDLDTVGYSRLSSVTGTNTITATGPVSMTAYAIGQRFLLIPANTTGTAVTLNITPSGGSALGAKDVFYNGAACTGGELRQNVPVIVAYDGTQFQIIGSLGKRGTYTGTLTGCTTSPTVTVTYTVVDNVVTLQFSGNFSATSNATTKTVTGMPTHLFPAATVNFCCFTGDNGGATISSYADIGTDGVMNIYNGPAGAAFTGSGAFFFRALTTTYQRG
ncbi:MAG: hypothetical protein E6R03_06020 [Hyphomicrobiaceae bacterium]|nr:MAG: hypothetical protein E6R03_06020 [Hyphomicrobiaceae bacterium]